MRVVGLAALSVWGVGFGVRGDLGVWGQGCRVTFGVWGAGVQGDVWGVGFGVQGDFSGVGVKGAGWLGICSLMVPIMLLR